jgi:hypothetical protein
VAKAAALSDELLSGIVARDGGASSPVESTGDDDPLEMGLRLQARPRRSRIMGIRMIKRFLTGVIGASSLVQKNEAGLP